MNRGLQVHQIHFAYDRGVPVLRDVSARMSLGVLTALVGPNGSGKSTLLRIAAGILTPQQGAVTLHDRPLHRFNRQSRARMIAFLPQAVQPLYPLSVFETVCLGRFPHTGTFGALSRHDLNVAHESLEAADCLELKDRPFMTLSGGERQRVLLAGILAQEPQFMLLDEPTSALDIHHVVEVFELLRQLARRGYGMVVVTHDLNLAAQYCEQVILLDEHHALAATGGPEEVFREEVLSAAYGATIRVGRNPFFDAPLMAGQTERRSP